MNDSRIIFLYGCAVHPNSTAVKKYITSLFIYRRKTVPITATKTAACPTLRPRIYPKGKFLAQSTSKSGS